MGKISVVINTLNEEKDLKRALESVKWADEIVVCDMHSTDQTVEIAKKYGAKVFLHDFVDFVEPARNFAISKATGDWILILDPDEEIPTTLAERLQEIANTTDSPNYILIPRKNIIFNKWVQASMWWPDYNIRFFQKGDVSWSDKIHRPPKVKGVSFLLGERKEFAITHYHYQTISQFLRRMDRYTNVQARELIENGYKFSWKDLIEKPLSEFLSRFFANKGFQDGLHGLALSFLQAFSFLILYLKVWEQEGFKEKELQWDEIKNIQKQSGKEIDYWVKHGNLSSNPAKAFLQKLRNKLD